MATVHFTSRYDAQKFLLHCAANRIPVLLVGSWKKIRVCVWN